MIRFDTPLGTIEIRELTCQEEMADAEQIQREVWGADIIPHPKELLIPVQHEGGLLAGAFAIASRKMVGLIFSFPTRDPDVQHSQMLGTLEKWRGAGIGTRLKWFQRDWCLERGIHRIRWTVDPLRAANAVLNISHLGATASIYYVDYYGRMQGIDAGAPTDRLLVEWELNCRRVMIRSVQNQLKLIILDAPSTIEVVNDIPGKIYLDLDSTTVSLRIPRDYIRICRDDPKLALEWRMKTREIFRAYFGRGYKIVEFSLEGGPAYILENVKSSIDD